MGDFKYWFYTEYDEKEKYFRIAVLEAGTKGVAYYSSCLGTPGTNSSTEEPDNWDLASKEVEEYSDGIDNYGYFFLTEAKVEEAMKAIWDLFPNYRRMSMLTIYD